MSDVVEREFPAKALLTGLRSIGYSFSTAVADIIDNSISAQATEVYLYSDPLASVPYFCILDNGRGMSSEELDNAMLPGSDREGVQDSEVELGRFGLGLKSASLSQCREFTVASKRYGKLRAMSFDLDIIEKKNRLLLKVLTSEEINELPYIEKLKTFESGTLVVWTKFDKIEGLAKHFEDSFRSLVSDSKKHVELVFHRYYHDVSIYFHDKRIEKRDPFLLDSIGRQQTGRTSCIKVNGANIIVVPYTLPFANSLTSEEKALLGNPKSIYDDQGFYLYRNKRLISWGSWMHMGIRSELNKLARIRVDIPSTLDSVWMLDVKKSSAKIPDKIKDLIKMAVEDSIVRSKRTTKFPGTKEQSVEFKVWDRINEHEGKIRYQINRTTPAITALNEILDEKGKTLLDIALTQIEGYLPKYSISNDGMDALTIVNSGDESGEDSLIEEIEEILSLYDAERKQLIFDSIFLAEGYQKLYT
ncbi:MAG: ATP-binding protein [Clostridia bacterium]|nr:ATP-binding protein [Clostridia bacterium]